MNRQAIRAQCEQSFYEELYHDDSGKQSIVRDRVSGRIYCRKVLSVYNVAVFAYLMSHPDIHVPRIHSFREVDGRLIVLEELIAGDTLDYLLANDLLDEAQKKEVLLQICDGLVFLHEADPPIIHRDLKPSNIMVTDEGTVKIIDYDAAKTFDKTETRDTILIGTRGSAAPEQYGFGKCDERTDIYSLGILIRDMFPEDVGMQRIAARATQLSPDQRYQHVREIRTRLAGTSSAARLLFRKKPDRKGINLPGFRTLTWWKMILASFGYALLLWFFLTFTLTQDGKAVTGAALWVNRVSILAIVLCWLDLFTDWSGLWKRIPLLHSRNILLRILGYVLAAVVIVLFWALVCAAVLDVLS